jgi:hypothetical protein
MNPAWLPIFNPGSPPWGSSLLGGPPPGSAACNARMSWPPEGAVHGHRRFW